MWFSSWKTPVNIQIWELCLSPSSSIITPETAAWRTEILAKTWKKQKSFVADEILVATAKWRHKHNVSNNKRKSLHFLYVLFSEPVLRKAKKILSASLHEQMQDHFFWISPLFFCCCSGGEFLKYARVTFSKHFPHQIATNPSFHKLENLLLDRKKPAASQLKLNLGLTLGGGGTVSTRLVENERRWKCFFLIEAYTHITTHFNNIQGSFRAGDRGNAWLQYSKILQL